MAIDTTDTSLRLDHPDPSKLAWRSWQTIQECIKYVQYLLSQVRALLENSTPASTSVGNEATILAIFFSEVLSKNRAHYSAELIHLLHRYRNSPHTVRSFFQACQWPVWLLASFLYTSAERFLIVDQPKPSKHDVWLNLDLCGFLRIHPLVKYSTSRDSRWHIWDEWLRQTSALAGCMWAIW